MTIPADIHAALMGRVETLNGFEIVWPTTGQREPVGEHVKVFHLPNDNDRPFLAEHVLMRQGILQLSLFSRLGEHEVVYIDRAGQIAAHFPVDLTLTHGGAKVWVERTDVGRGRSDGQHWLIPVSVYYRGFA